MLETERLILREMNAQDADAVFALRNDRDVMRFIREPQSRAEAGKWISLVSSRWANEKIGIGAVVEKRSGALIGWCGLWRLEENNEIEIGYAIAKEFWRRGYATEAARRFLEYGFGDLNLDKIVAVTRPENLSSRRVMEKIGMSYDYTGKFYDRDLEHYSIAKNKWIRQNHDGAKNSAAAERL